MVRRIILALARMVVATGCCLVLAGATVAIPAIHHNMDWRRSEAAVVCVRDNDSDQKICSLNYIVGGVKFTRASFRSDSAPEGLLGQERIYYQEGAPSETAFSRDCGLGIFVGQTTALLGLLAALPGILILRFLRP